MDLVAERRRAARRAQRGMEHRAPLGRVDRRAGEHRVALRLDAAFARQVGEEAQRRRVDEVLRQVGEDLGRVERQRVEPARIARERLAQVEVAAVRLEVAGERGPGGGAVAARRTGRPFARKDVEVARWREHRLFFDHARGAKHELGGKDMPMSRAARAFSSELELRRLLNRQIARLSHP